MPLRPVALWGLQVPAGVEGVSAIGSIPDTTFHITMAALDPTAEPKNEKEPKRATLKIIRQRLNFPGDSDESDLDVSETEEETGQKAGKKSQKKPSKKSNGKDEMDVDQDEDSDDDSDVELEEFVLCTLDTDKHYQQPLDIVIAEHEEVYFKSVGNYDICLTGNYVVAESEDNHDEDPYGYDLSPSEDSEDGVDGFYDDEDESDELDDVDSPPRIQEIDTDDEVNTTTNDAKKDKKKADKAGKKKKNSLKRPADESADEAQETIDELINKAKKAASTEGEKKLSKKQLKKLKANDGKAIDSPADKTKESKKVQFAKELEQGPTPSPSSKKTEKPVEKSEKPAKADKADKPTKADKAENFTKADSSDKPAKAEKSGKPAQDEKPKKVVNGVTIMDSKVGQGAPAKKGNKLSMRYIGKLENGKVFDKNTNGKPFAFRLGAGEVIKGWDIGLEGMRIGGERRLNIPSSLAYGKQSMPDIPANSNLIFDVKLLSIK